MSRSTRALVRVFVVSALLLAATLLVSSRTHAQEPVDPSIPPTTAAASASVPAIDFTFLGDIPQDVQDALARAMQEEGNLLPWQESYTVTYLDVGEEWITGSLIPTVVVQSGWEVWPEGARVIDILARRTPNSVTTAHLNGSVAFLSFAAQVPPTVGDYSVFASANSATNTDATYKAPWKEGDKWIRGKYGFHANAYVNILPGTNALDFLPNGYTPEVLASGKGTVSPICADDYQVALKIEHSGGQQTGYLHLSRGSVEQRFANITTKNGNPFAPSFPSVFIPVQGASLGTLFSGNKDLRENLAACPDYDEKGKPIRWLFRTKCGCGTDAHVHFFVTDRNKMKVEAQGTSDLLTSAAASYPGSGWTSTNKPTSCTDDKPEVNQVIAFSEKNFGGQCKPFNKNDQEQKADFTIKSLRVGVDMQATMSGKDYRGSITGGDDDADKWKEYATIDGDTKTLKVGWKQCDSDRPEADQIYLYSEANYGGACHRHDLAGNTERDFDTSNDYKLSGEFRSVKLGESLRVKLCQNEKVGSPCTWFATDTNDFTGKSLRLQQRDVNPPEAKTFEFAYSQDGVVYSNDGTITVRVRAVDQGPNAVGVKRITVIREDNNSYVWWPPENQDYNEDQVYDLKLSVCNLSSPLRRTVQVELSMVDKLDQSSSYQSRSATLLFPDIDGNCKVEVLDAIRLIRMIFVDEGDDGNRPDVNNDGRFDLLDVIATISIIFGPVPGQPAAVTAAETTAPLTSAEPARIPVLEYVTTAPLSSDAKSVMLAGSRAYIAASFNSSLHILDISADAPPVLAFSVPLNGTVATDVDIASSRLFVTQPFKSIADPPVTSLTTLNLPADGSLPTITADYNWGIYARRIATDGIYAYVAGDESPLFRIYDVTDAAAPQLLADYPMQGRVSDLIVAGSTAFVTDDSVGILVFDVSSRSNPVVIGTLAAPGTQLRLAYQAPLMAITDRAGYIHIADVTNPAAPVLLSTIPGISVPKSSQLVGNLLFVAAGEEGVFAFDIANPSAPRLIGQYNTAGNAQELAYQEGRIYVADGDSGVQTLALHPECAGPYYSQFFTDQELSSQGLVYATCDTALNHNWGEGGPGNGIGIDNFSVRSAGKVSFAEGSYTFSAQADDGIRVYVDGTILIDAWEVTGSPIIDAAIYLTAGEHDIRVEYREIQGTAAYNVTWQPTPAPEVCLRADAALGQSYSGAFDERAQVQRFCVNAAANQWLSARAFAAADSTLDPSLQIYDPNGQLVAANDDGIALDLNAAVTYQAPADGVYQMAVSNPNSQGGSFQVRAEAGPQASPADVDFNCLVETADRDLLNANLGSANPVYDINLNGSVDAQDVEIVQNTLDVYGSGGVRCDGTIYPALTPDLTTKRVNPGASGVYAVTVFNAGTFPTGFDVQVKSAGWPAAADIAILSPVAPDSSTLFSVTVQVPNGIALGATNDTIITVLPQVNPALARSVTVQTVATGSALSRANSTASSALGTWPAASLVDGSAGTVWSSGGHTEHLTGAEWAAVGLAQRATVDRIRIRPRGNPNDPGNTLGFPKDFVIQYSFNGTDEAGVHTCDPNNRRYRELPNWKPFLALYGYAQPADEWIDFRFIPRQADCIRIFGAELSQDDYGARYLQLAEIEVYSGGNKVSPSFATASSALGAWPAASLVDGSAGTVWSSSGHTEHLTGAEWAAVGLAQRATVDRIRIRPRGNPNDPGNTLGFPKDFVIQYSFNGTDEAGVHTCDPNNRRYRELPNWKPFLALYGYAQPADEWIDFRFIPRQADCIRIFGAELSQDDYGARYLQLAEIEVYSGGNKVSPSFATASSALGAWPAASLVDGSAGTVWSSSGHTEHLTGAEWAAAGLAQRATVDRIRIRPRGNPNDPGNTLGFPKDFVIQYSFNGTDEAGVHTCDPKNRRYKELPNWKPFLALYGYAQPADEWIDFRFIPRQADCIRVFGAELSQDDYGARYLQLAEIEVYGK